MILAPWKVPTFTQLLLLLFILVSTQQQTFWCNLTTSSLYTGVSTSHNFVCNFNNYTIPSASFFFFNYSSNWNFNSITYGDSADFCQSGCGTLTSSPNSIYNIKVLGYFPSTVTNGNFSIRYSIKSISNPLRISNQTITVSLLSSTNSLIVSVSLAVNIFPSFMICTATPTITTVNQVSPYTFTIKPNTNVPLLSSGVLMMSFPTRWKNSFTGQPLSYTSCSNGLGILCTNSASVLNATGLFAGVSTTSQFSFTLNSILNPGSEQPNDELELSYINGGNQASICRVIISGLTSPSVNGMTFGIVSNLGTLSFTNVQIPMSIDEIWFTLPTQIYLEDIVTVSINRNNSGGTSIDYTINQTSNTIIVTGAFTTNALLPMAISATMYIKTPITLTNFTSLSLRRFGFQYETGSCCSSSLSYQQNMTISASLSNYLLQGVSNYIFTITLTYYQLNYFYIDFSAGFNLAVNADYNCYISNTITANLLQCKAITANRLRIRFTNTSLTFTSYFGYKTSYNIVVIGLTNPSSDITVNISSYYNPAEQLQFSPHATITYVSNKIVNAKIVASNLQVGAVSTYSFVINNTNILAANSVINIYFPYKFSLTSIFCSLAAVPITCTLENSTFLKFPLSNSIVNQYSLASISIQVNNVENPNSLQPTPSFGIELLSGGTLLVESLYQGITVKMTTEASFNSLSIAASSFIVRALASYTISFSHLIRIMNSSSITLQFILPSSYTLVACSNCISYRTFLLTNTTSSVAISKVYNPYKSSQSNPIRVYLYIDGYLSISGNFIMPNFTLESLTYTLYSNSSLLGEPTDINITIIEFPTKAKFLTIAIPSEYTFSTFTLISLNTNFTFSRSSSNVNITINAFEMLNITFIMQGIINPIVVSGSAWQLNIYDSSNNQISFSSSLNAFSASCGNTCKRCVNISYCLSCYSNPAINSLTYLNKATNLCISSCLTNQFQVRKFCYNCDSNCLTCSIFSTNCTSCLSSFLFNSTCLTQCIVGYYPIGTVCTICTNNCFACSSATICLSCINSFVLSNASCLAGCPSGTYNSSNDCVNCPSNCSTCNSNGCITCEPSNYIILIAFPICISACAENYYISSNGSNCEACNSQCLSCSIRSNNCTACNQASLLIYLHSFQCLPICPVATFADQLKQCQPCVPPCLFCTSPSNCSSCLTGYFYNENSQCIANCVLNMITINSTCVLCTSNCLTCSIAVNNCTSCIESYFLNGNTCSQNCSLPNVTYLGLCTDCITPCLQCNANSTNNCSSCISGYFFYAFTCYQACPNNTYQNAFNTCALCSSTCYTCNVSPSNCTECYSGRFLLNNVCHLPCPGSLFLVKSNGSCSTCSPLCSSCITFSTQCSSCALPTTYYFNSLTSECALNCSDPYFIRSASMICQLCKLPCKSCLVESIKCNSCYAGKFLLNQLCIDSCPVRYYNDTIDSICIACPALCDVCDDEKCLICISGNLFYQGRCYVNCPAQVPYTYLNYCRNCQKTSCLICNQDGICVVCIPPYLNFNGDCLVTCPTDYEADLLTASRCILQQQVAYSDFKKRQEHKKIWLFPSSIFLLLSLTLVFFSEVKLFFVAFALAIPQSIALVQFAVHFYYQYKHLLILIVANWFFIVLIAISIALSIIYSLIFYRLLQSKKFQSWINYGNNSFRFSIVFFCSLWNKQAIFLLFTALFNLPFTSFSFKPTKIFYFIHSFCTFYQLGILTFAAILAFYEKTEEYNLKLYYSGLDCIIVYGFSFIFNLIFLKLVDKVKEPTPYKKFILPHVSDVTVIAYSERVEEEIQEDPSKNFRLYRSNSDEGLHESQEIKNIKFGSQIDSDEFFDMHPKVRSSQIPESVQKGDFRKKKKKKRGQRRLKFGLQMIQQESDDEQNESPKNKNLLKKKRNRKEQDIGGLKNYIYWKKPKQKKVNPGKVFVENEKTIMSRIKQKQSQFDSITQNDIIFQDDIVDSSSDDDYRKNEQSRRALQTPKYDRLDTYFNLHYAQKQHLRDK